MVPGHQSLALLPSMFLVVMLSHATGTAGMIVTVLYIAEKAKTSGKIIDLSDTI